MQHRVNDSRGEMLVATKSDRNLLFGVFALQTDAITQEQLVHAVHAYVADHQQSLADLLCSLGALDDSQRAALEALVDARLQTHDDEVAQTLAHGRAAEPIPSLPQDTRDSDARLEPPSAESLALGRTHVTAVTPSTASITALRTVPPAKSDHRFRILRFHDRGGLGNVYLAEDTELRREVALKELKKETADDPASRQRFVNEAEITGGLEHPGIVPVYGLGHYDDGRPFYAMRFIKGDNLETKIVEYHSADWNQRGGVSGKHMELRRLLNCFVDVCQAVHYAHQRGVLHRDIKPGNIMIGPYGETLVVDWGLAKPLGQRPLDETVGLSQEEAWVPSSNSTPSATRLGSAIGTPKFMSPEQARGDHERLGVATDIFSLGATLYYLLTNCGPYDGQADVLEAARNGHITPPRERRSDVVPALASICSKALSLQPADRYESALALANDVEQFLGDEPVTAHHESLRERAVRLARRHRAWTQAAAIALIAMALVSFAAALLINGQKNLAQVARADAQAAADRTQRVLDYLVNAFRRADPSVDGRKVTVVSVMDQAVAKVDELLADDPLEKAQLLQALGQTYYGLGQLNEAEDAIQEAYRMRASTLGDSESRNVGEQVGTGHDLLCQERIGLCHPRPPGSAHCTRASLGQADTDTIRSLTNLAMSYFAADRIAEALDLCEEVVRLRTEQLGDDHPDTLIAMTNLANCYDREGRVEEALDIFERVFARQKAKLGADHSDTLATMNNLALTQLRVGQADEAVALLEETLARRQEKYGEDHPQTIQTMNHLARAYFAAHKLDKAFPMYQQALKRSREILGMDHRETLVAMNNLANAYHITGQWTLAIPMYRQTLELQRTQLGDEHAQTLMTMRNLAKAYGDVEQFESSASLWKELMDHFCRKYGASNAHLGGRAAVAACLPARKSICGCGLPL